MEKKITHQVITPKKHFFDFELRQMWQWRALLKALVARDLQVRYKNTALGIAWAIIQPLLATIIFTLIFTRIFFLNGGNDNYLVYTLTGFILWQFLQNSLSAASISVYEQIGMVRKIYFPRLFLPLAVILRCLVDLSITSIVLVVVIIWQKINLTPVLIIGYLLTVIALAIFTMGIGFLFACLNARYRDFRLLIPFVLQIWFYATPVFYDSQLLSNHLHWLLWVNPPAQFLTFARDAILGQSLNWQFFYPGLLASVIILILTTGIFHQLETEMVDAA